MVVKGFKKWILLIGVIGLTACSWEYHRSHYKTPFHNPQPGTFYTAFDSIVNSEHGNCSRKRFYIKDGDWLHMSSCECEDLWLVDSAFDERGRLYISFNRHLVKSKQYLYDSSATVYYDRKGRPLKRYIDINQADTTYEYWHYYDALGNPEAEKRPVIYSILEGE